MTKANELKEGDFVLPTNEANQDLPHLSQFWGGGTIKKVENNIAEVHFVNVERIHISRLTKVEDAFDPIP